MEIFATLGKLHGWILPPFSLCTCFDLLGKAEGSSVCKHGLNRTEVTLVEALAPGLLCRTYALSIHQLEANWRSSSDFDLYCISIIQVSVKHMQSAQVITCNCLQEEEKKKYFD